MPEPKWLFGTWSTPPHWLPSETATFGFADAFKSCLVAATLRRRAGNADQSSATTPTTWGPAIDVPLRLAYDVSLVLTAERTFTPGPTTSGLIRFDPSAVTGPRLLKPASRLSGKCPSIAPVE